MRYIFSLCKNYFEIAVTSLLIIAISIMSMNIVIGSLTTIFETVDIKIWKAIFVTLTFAIGMECGRRGISRIISLMNN